MRSVVASSSVFSQFEAVNPHLHEPASMPPCALWQLAVGRGHDGHGVYRPLNLILYLPTDVSHI
eukprot:3915826-Pleurochrysis_carterae.AAC.1